MITKSRSKWLHIYVKINYLKIKISYSDKLFVTPYLLRLETVHGPYTIFANVAVVVQVYRIDCALLWFDFKNQPSFYLTIYTIHE